MNTIRDHALAYAEAGLSVIPVGMNKRPVIETWKQYESEIADAETIRQMFYNGANVAIITGAVSGGLLAIDFDDPRFYLAWREQVGNLAELLPVQKTGKGYHVLCRCPEPGGNQKLAFMPDDNELSGRRAAIETRGEGGYFLADPSIHGETGRRYEVVSGTLTAIPTIPQAHADALLQAARKLDECPLTRQQRERETKSQPRPAPSGGESVINAFNRATSIESILEKHGYSVKGTRAIRPGGEHLSITIRDGKSFHHNTSDPLSDSYWRDAFSVFCQLDHGGDVKAAVRAAAESLGLQSEPRRQRAASPASQPPPPQASDPDPLPFNLTDLGNAERLAAWHGDKLRHVPAWGWLVWNGKRWERNGGAAVRLAKEAVRMIYQEAARGLDEDERNAIAQWAMKSESEHHINAMLGLAESDAVIEARPEMFDSDPMLLNCANGTLDLRTGELHAHDPADRLTRLIGAEYHPDAPAPTWEAFLFRVMGGRQTLIDFLRRAIGYSLTGDTGEQCLFFCYGRGANGKSTFLETIRALSGEYAQTTEFETLLAKRNTSGAANPEIARMSGVRFVTAIEAGEGRRLNEPVIKALTGGDAVTARHLYHDHFEFHPQFKLWLAANHKPTVKGTDEAIWRRIRLIPFTVTIPEGERDPKLAAKLRAELPGILAWAVRGCLEWQAEGLGTPDEVRAATEQYRAEQDVLAAFLEECCVQKPEAEAGAGKLLEAYKSWTGESIDAKELRQKLTERGFKQQHTKRGNVWQGIGLVDLLSGEGEGR